MTDSEKLVAALAEIEQYKGLTSQLLREKDALRRHVERAEIELKELKASWRCQVQALRQVKEEAERKLAAAQAEVELSRAACAKDMEMIERLEVEGLEAVWKERATNYREEREAARDEATRLQEENLRLLKERDEFKEASRLKAGWLLEEKRKAVALQDLVIEALSVWLEPFLEVNNPKAAAFRDRAKAALSAEVPR